MPLNEVMVDCPTCGASSGYACLTSGHRTRRMPHKARKLCGKHLGGLVCSLTKDHLGCHRTINPASPEQEKP